MSGKQGFVYLLILMAVIAVVFFASTVFNLNQNLRTQVSHIAYKDISFSSAYSIMSGIQARVYKSGWADRFFAVKPVQVYGLALGEAACDYYIEDTPGAEQQMDVYIRVNLTSRSQLYFWRVVYHDDIFDFSTHFSSIFFTTLDPKKFPPENEGVSIASEVDAMLATRAENADRARQTIATVIDENDTVKIARNLGAPIPVMPPETEDFSARFPISGAASPTFIPAVSQPPEEGPPMSLPQSPPDIPQTTAAVPLARPTVPQANPAAQNSTSGGNVTSISSVQTSNTQINIGPEQSSLESVDTSSLQINDGPVETTVETRSETWDTPRQTP